MDVTVRYYAAASAATGLEQETLPLPGPRPVRELADELARRHGPALATVLQSSSFLIDGVAGGQNG